MQRILVNLINDFDESQLKGLGGFQRLKTGTFLLFSFLYPMKYFIQTVCYIKDTYLISTL